MARSRKTKDKPASSKRPIEQYDHKGQRRKNNPHVGLVTPDSDREAPKKQYAYDHNLKAEIDTDRIEAYRGNVSLPFEAGPHKRVGIKIVDDRGIESLKIIPVP
jgi:hypothetical protein